MSNEAGAGESLSKGFYCSKENSIFLANFKGSLFVSLVCCERKTLLDGC
jgi:hypothetical protein